MNLTHTMENDMYQTVVKMYHYTPNKKMTRPQTWREKRKGEGKGKPVLYVCVFKNISESYKVTHIQTQFVSKYGK